MKTTLFAIGFLLRVLIIFGTPPVLDVQNFERSAAIFARGGNIYVEQYYYNYSPAIGLPLLIAHATPLPFGVAWRLLLSLASLTAAILISRLSGWQRGLIYWFNPAVIFLDSFAGQSDGLALLLLLAALHYSPVRFPLGVLAILVKHITVFMTWTLFVYAVGWKRAVLWMVAAVALFVLSFALYLPAGAEHIVSRVLLYRSWPYGLQSSVLFFVVMPLVPLVAKRLNLSLIQAMSLTALVQFTVTYGATSQNFSLLLAWPAGWLAPVSAIVALYSNPFVYGLETPASLLWLWAITALTCLTVLAFYIRRSLNRWIFHNMPISSNCSPIP